MPEPRAENILKEAGFDASRRYGPVIGIMRKIGLAAGLLLFGAVFNLTLAAASAQAEPQEYLGEIPFKNSEGVKIHFFVSEDGREIQKTLFNLKKLYLKPESKKSGVDNVTMTDAGLTDDTVYKIVDGKVTADSFFVFDLTVIDSCIYGTIGIKYEMDKGVMTADPVYVVIPNITAPKDIPQNILKP